MKGFRHTVIFKIGAALLGPVIVGFTNYAISCLVPPSYQDQAWHLYLLSVGGFIAAYLGAWALRHGLGWLYGLGLGLLVGLPLCLMHGMLAMVVRDHELGCVLEGDRVAGVLFGLVSLLGGYLGTRGAGVRPYLVKGPLTWKRRVLLGLLACAYVGVWVAAWFAPQIAFYLDRH